MRPASARGAKPKTGLPWVAAIAVAAGLTSAYWAWPSKSEEPPPPPVEVQVAPPPEPEPPPPVLEPEPITPELERKGFNVCNPHDPIGLGPYRPYIPLSTGRALIPQQGGYSEDHGYDVVVHFHGHRAARIPFVQVSRGTVFVGSDFGVGSHSYSKKFAVWRRFPHLLRSLNHALKKASGFDDAHIRHLTLSAWSAGYGAINEILKLHGDEDVDAVVLLDGLHASWHPQAPRQGGVDTVMLRRIEPIVSFARKAQQGEKLFFFTHSYVRTNSYVSTKLTADRLLLDLELQRTSLSPSDDPEGRDSAVDVEGFHLWSYEGDREMAHCSHLRLLATIVRDFIEPAFDTPYMNRDVPNTKAPDWGATGMKDGGAAEGGIVDAGAGVVDAAVAATLDSGKPGDRDGAIAHVGDAGGAT